MTDKLTDATRAMQGDDIVFEAHVPGIEPDDVKVEVADGVLRVSGERREESWEEEGARSRQQIKRRSFARSAILPRDADLTRLRTSVEDGTVRVILLRGEGG